MKGGEKMGAIKTAISTEEQETVIQISRSTKVANIYTTDTRKINKLDKMYERKVVHKQGREMVAVEYEVPEKLISYRAGKPRATSAAEKKAMADRMKKARVKK